MCDQRPGVHQECGRFTAVAMLVAPDIAAKAGPFPAAITRMLIPFEVFTDKDEALVFLRGFLPDE